MMHQLQIENLLRQTIGIDAVSLGSSMVERAIRGRMADCKMKDASEYWAYLQQSEVELSQLTEAVVVPETWFFRDREPFAILNRFVVSEWLPAHATGELRLLSAPCATGEEPYSMAMALLDAGLPPQRFRIDAVDISSQALAQAKRGVFYRNSFRGKLLDFRERYFKPTPDGQLLSESVRQQVHFRQANLASPEFLPGRECYDVIFCRNVLIYFDRPTQERVIQSLGRLLSPTGLLFVGHAETGLFVDSAFVSAKLPMAFAYRKASVDFGKEPKKGLPSNKFPAKPTRSAIVPNRSGVAPPAPLPRQPQRDGSGPAPRSAQPAVAEKTDASRDQELETATRLADAGRLDEAAKLCEAHLRKHGASAPGYYLLGVVRDAQGDKQLASECYRKAIYLEPNHYEALLQLALLAEQLGDGRDAGQWHNRARRVKERTKAA